MDLNITTLSKLSRLYIPEEELSGLLVKRLLVGVSDVSARLDLFELWPDEVGRVKSDAKAVPARVSFTFAICDLNLVIREYKNGLIAEFKYIRTDVA